MASQPVLSRRALNRALLERQLLTRREALTVPEAIERVAGLQAQEPPDPHHGLLARLEEFRTDQLDAALVGREVVRTVVMRSTIHMVTPRDAAFMRPLVQPVLERELFGPWRTRVAGMDIDAVVAAGTALLAERPRTARQLGLALAERFPEHEPQALAYAVRCRAPLVQIPPRGTWGASHAPTLTTLQAWTGVEPDPEADVEELVRRYLAAFGPATPGDVQAWSRLTGLRAVLERMRPSLVTYRDERGRELFDLPGAPLPDPATPAAPRLLPEYDNVFLSHADRSRVVAEEDRRRLSGAGGRPVLIDGFVAGTWRLERDGDAATVVIAPLRRVAPADEEALRAEAERLLQRTVPEAGLHTVRVERPADG